MGDDGLPAPEIMKRFEDAVKKYNETPVQAKPKAAPKSGVLESEVLEHGIVLNVLEARDHDEQYAVVDSAHVVLWPLSKVFSLSLSEDPTRLTGRNKRLSRI